MKNSVVADWKLENMIQHCAHQSITSGKTIQPNVHDGSGYGDASVYEVQEFQFIPLALRLVALVLVQPSSCLMWNRACMHYYSSTYS
jgi:hypothetical protein